MEPRREERKTGEARLVEKPKRFRIIKLEERIAPGSASTHGSVCNSNKCTTDPACNLSIE